MTRFVVYTAPSEHNLTEWQIRSSRTEELKPGDPLPWSFGLDGDVPSDDYETKFTFYVGEARKFTFVGTYSVACAVLAAVGRGAEITRCAMRFALMVPAVAEIYGEPARAEAEKVKAFGFMRWMGALGATLLIAGLRPWQGTIGEAVPAPGSFAVPESTEIN